MDPFASIEVVNRRNIPYEGMFDGIAIVFKPHQKKHYPPNVAYALCSSSGIKIDLASGVTTTFALGITDEPAFPTDPLDGPLADKNNVEVLDRTNVERLTETEPQVLSKDGPESLGIGKVDKTVTPLPGAEESSQPALKPAAADQVQPVSFVNDQVRTGPSRKGPAEHRVNNKPL